MTTAEREAIKADATARLAELRRVRGVLWGDRDDPEVMSELVVVLGQIKAAERTLAEEDATL